MSSTRHIPEAPAGELLPAGTTARPADPLDAFLWLPCQLRVEIPVVGFVLGTLAELSIGTIVETAVQHNEDLPLTANGQLARSHRVRGRGRPARRAPDEHGMSFWTPAATLIDPRENSACLPETRPWQRSHRLLRRAWSWISERRALQARSRRRLTVTETVSLGEKRFLSIVTIDDTQFLIGGSPSQVALLAQLDPKDQPAATFAGVLEQQLQRGEQSR